MSSKHDKARSARNAFEKRRGFWSPVLDGTAAMDPGFLDAYANFSAEVLGDTLDPKTRELVSIGVDVAIGYREGLAIHIPLAEKFGATRAEIAAVIRQSALAGIHDVFVAYNVWHSVSEITEKEKSA